MNLPDTRGARKSHSWSQAPTDRLNCFDRVSVIACTRILASRGTQRVVSFSRGIVSELERKAGSGVEGLEGDPLTGFRGVLRGVPELIASHAYGTGA